MYVTLVGTGLWMFILRNQQFCMVRGHYQGELGSICHVDYGVPSLVWDKQNCFNLGPRNPDL